MKNKGYKLWELKEVKKEQMNRKLLYKQPVLMVINF